MSEALPICVVTGLSGAGKSTAIAAFEELGYFTVDGLPAQLVPQMVAMLEQSPADRPRGLALGVDLRQKGLLEELQGALAEVPGVTLLFLDASDGELLKRYAFTRRTHPLERQGLGLAQAIAAERSQLTPLREHADVVVDSTGFNIHHLRRVIMERFRGGQPGTRALRVNVVSFGFKHGVPEDADYVFDLRFLPNPYFEPELKELSGLDAAVAKYIFASGEAEGVFGHILELLNYVLPLMEASGRSRTTVGLGCTGGRHRSVALAERLGRELAQLGWPTHRDHRHLKMAETP